MKVGGGGNREDVVVPEEVREEARKYGEAQLGHPGQAWLGAVRAAMQWAGGGWWAMGRGGG